MSDIMKFIVGKESGEEEITGHLRELDEWNKNIGLSLAKEEGIEMTPEHWEVVRFLRRHYAEHGEEPSARKLTEILEEAFATKGGRQYLYRLFPKGPVIQASKIAGLPVPQHAVDPSFGSSQ